MFVGFWPKESEKVQGSCWDSFSIGKQYGLDRLVGSGLSWAKQRSWKARPTGIPNLFGSKPSGQRCQYQRAASNSEAFSLKRWLRDDSWVIFCIRWGLWLREGIQALCCWGDRVGKQQTQHLAMTAGSEMEMEWGFLQAWSKVCQRKQKESHQFH